MKTFTLALLGALLLAAPAGAGWHITRSASGWHASKVKPDHTAPVVTITNGPANGTATDATFTFTATDNVGVTGVTCSLDGSAFTACSSPASYSGLSVASHSLQVRARDAAGNAGTATWNWTISNGSPPPPPPPPSGTTIRDRVGVNVHAQWSAYSDITQVNSQLAYLGIDLVRDTGQNPSSGGPKLAAMNANVIVYCGGEFNTWWGEGSESTCVSGAKANIPRLIAVEGANEPYSCSGETSGSDQVRLVNHMTRLRDAAAAYAGLDVYSVSNCAGGGGTDWWSQPFISGIVNNAHSYANPGSYPTLSQLDGWIANTQFAAPGRYVATEMGPYQPNDFGAATGAAWTLVDVLHHLYRNTERMAIYELHDSGSDASPFGLFTATGTPRQSADALHNLMGLIGSTTAGPLTTTTSVSDPTALQMTFTDGSAEYVALWNRSSTAARSVTLTLGEPRAATVYRPVTSATGTALASSSSVTVSLSDDPVIVRIR